MLQNVGGSEWARSQNRLCGWRCKEWHGLHESSYCYFKVYAGTRNLKLEDYVVYAAALSQVSDGVRVGLALATA